MRSGCTPNGCAGGNASGSPLRPPGRLAPSAAEHLAQLLVELQELLLALVQQRDRGLAVAMLEGGQPGALEDLLGQLLCGHHVPDLVRLVLCARLVEAP